MAIIYKILRAEEWADLRDNGESQGAPVDVTDGFIHFSTAETVKETAALHFAGETGLMLLAYEGEDFGDALVYEPSRGGLLFPHLFAPLSLNGLLWSENLDLVDGIHVFPKDMA